MTDVQEFCLRWNNHQSNLVSAFHDLRQDEDFVDVTLACDGRSLYAHKVVLSACSPFFREILKTTPCKHPVIVLKDVLFRDLVALLEFMYQGEVRVGHDGLPSFLKTAEVLRVRGLTEDVSRHEASQIPFDHTTKNGQNHNLPASNPSYSPSLGQQNSFQLDNATSPEPGGGDASPNCTGSAEKFKMEEDDLDSNSNSDAGLRHVEVERRKSKYPQGLPQLNQINLLQHQQQQRDKQQHKEMDLSISEDETKELKQPYAQEADESAAEPGITSDVATAPAPCLTLQRFARIPSLLAQDLNSSLNSQDFAGQEHPLPPVLDDRRFAQELQMSLDQDNLVGRAPGRTSTSDRPRWPCPFCMRLLSSRSSVRRHIEDRHTNDNSRHQCHLCDRLYRTRNSLQYHLSTAHRDREPGPRGRPRTRPRTPSATDSAQLMVNDNKNNHEADANSHPVVDNPTSRMLFNLSARAPPFGFPPT